MEQHEAFTESDLVKYRLDHAEQDLKAAEIMMQNHLYGGSLNRSYYAIFHAINAIHALDGKSYKRHKDTIGNFNKEYIRSGKFPREYGRLINRAAEVRMGSDYADYYDATEEEARLQFDFAENFLSSVKKYCNSISGKALF